MLYLLKRHPIPIEANFEYTLVLTYAFPKQKLEDLLPPGLILDTFGNYGFIAIALVQTHALRPRGLPAWLGQSFFLTGYRLFTRFRTSSGRSLRGLRILRSDTNRWLMCTAGNMLTHYNYRLADTRWSKQDNQLQILVKTKREVADLEVNVDLRSEAAKLPGTTVFEDAKEARRFAGPLPFTFDYERKTNSIILIEGVRQNWEPRLVTAKVRKATFFNQEAYAKLGPPRFSSAYYLENIPYMWKSGIREPIAEVDGQATLCNQEFKD